MESIGIGTLAKRAGAGIDTVRYYERKGAAGAQSSAGFGIPPL
jgi:hypothetical protein